MLAEGRPLVIVRIAPYSRAIVMAHLPGEQGGQALADVPFGVANPSDKLPFTYPNVPNGSTTCDYRPLENKPDYKTLKIAGATGTLTLR